jgi:pimeloyl-ACP methyl ester carboxylesterase
MRELARDLRLFPVALIIVAFSGLSSGGSQAEMHDPTEISFPTSDGGEIHAHLYGSGSHAVVLAHGKVFDKESWQPLAERLADQGHRVLALDFRGYGRSTAGSEARRLDSDVLGAVAFLESQDTDEISLIGASMGGSAVGNAATQCEPGRLHKVVLLAPAPIDTPEDMQADEFVYIASTAGASSRVPPSPSASSSCPAAPTRNTSSKPIRPKHFSR